jgi:hypothetical protein
MLTLRSLVVACRYAIRTPQQRASSPFSPFPFGIHGRSTADERADLTKNVQASAVEQVAH